MRSHKVGEILDETNFPVSSYFRRYWEWAIKVDISRRGRRSDGYVTVILSVQLSPKKVSNYWAKRLTVTQTDTIGYIFRICGAGAAYTYENGLKIECNTIVGLSFWNIFKQLNA